MPWLTASRFAYDSTPRKTYVQERNPVCHPAPHSRRTDISDESPYGELRESFQNMRLCLTKTAELMNERDYEFKLTPVSRTFPGWVQHTAEMYYTACSKIHGMA
jgi:hypothetical protein